jgi:hypothetical protein
MVHLAFFIVPGLINREPGLPGDFQFQLGVSERQLSFSDK